MGFQLFSTTIAARSVMLLDLAFADTPGGAKLSQIPAFGPPSSMLRTRVSMTAKSPGLSGQEKTNMQSTSTSIENVGAALSQYWYNAVTEDMLCTRLQSGAEGRVVLAPEGGYLWSFRDEAGLVVDPPEREKRCGRFKIIWNWLRIRKAGALKTIKAFGELPAPSAESERCTLGCLQPDDPLSIHRRPRLLIMGKFMKLAALYNAFPYVPGGHCLLLPFEAIGEDVVFPHVEQRLHRILLHEFISITSSAADWVVGVNCLHTGASAWHAHGQLLRSKPFPVEEAFPVKVGQFSYPFGWPAGCLIVDNATADTVMDAVGRLEGRGIPVNLLVRGKKVFIFGRRREWELSSEFPTGAIAFSELCGRLLVGHEEILAGLTEELICRALRKATLTVEELLAAVSA